jgi:hypothetical protein
VDLFEPGYIVPRRPEGTSIEKDKDLFEPVDNINTLKRPTGNSIEKDKDLFELVYNVHTRPSGNSIEAALRRNPNKRWRPLRHLDQPPGNRRPPHGWGTLG